MKPELPPLLCSDRAATANTCRLMSYLRSIYGRQSLSGTLVGDADYVRKVTGKAPAILSGDFMSYSPAAVKYAGSMPADDVETLIEQARQGHIITMLWHWHAPKDLINKMLKDDKGNEINALWYKGFYTHATTFDVEKALAHPDSGDYQLLVANIDAIAAQLKKFSDAGVPVLWRPLHEAEGKWFWWGAKGPKPFVELWRLMHDRLSSHHQLHNLIWVYTGSANPDWYPGDRYVDIIGTDAYPADVADPLSSIWEELQTRFAGQKLLALTEFGGVPDIAQTAKFGVWWVYFVSWGGDLGPMTMSDADLIRIYHDPRVLNFEDLPRGEWSRPPGTDIIAPR